LSQLCNLCDGLDTFLAHKSQAVLDGSLKQVQEIFLRLFSQIRSTHVVDPRLDVRQPLEFLGVTVHHAASDKATNRRVIVVIVIVVIVTVVIVIVIVVVIVVVIVIVIVVIVIVVIVIVVIASSS